MAHSHWDSMNASCCMLLGRLYQYPGKTLIIALT